MVHRRRLERQLHLFPVCKAVPFTDASRKIVRCFMLRKTSDLTRPRSFVKRGERPRSSAAKPPDRPILPSLAVF